MNNHGSKRKPKNKKILGNKQNEDMSYKNIWDTAYAIQSNASVPEETWKGPHK